ncbi:MAG: DUF418 domain-containing protein [Balneolaceae bacterium]
MEKKSTLNPVGKDERIHVLDALRGFAIFGILMINIQVFSGYSYMMDGLQNELLLADWNSFFDKLHTIFFRGKFYTLFSLLFGIGFAIQFIRASSTDRSFTAHFSRRLFFLLLIGIVHLWAIWFGDILVLYAICGYLLILFKGFSNRGLLWTAFFILLLPGLNSWYLDAYDGGYTTTLYQWLSESWRVLDLPVESDEFYTFRMYDLAAVIQSDSWSTFFSFNYLGPLLRGYMYSFDGRFFKVLGIFVVGFWTGRQLLLHKIHENRPFLIKTAVVGLLLGIPMNIIFAMEDPINLINGWYPWVTDTLTTFRYIILTAGYVALFMLLFQTGLKNLLNRLFSAVGKTALSNYILQSILGIFLFYDVGLGLGKHLGLALLTLFVVIIFLFQVIISELWLKRYKYGPLEWIWRVLTYGRYIKNRIE